MSFPDKIRSFLRQQLLLLALPFTYSDCKPSSLASSADAGCIISLLRLQMQLCSECWRFRFGEIAFSKQRTCNTAQQEPGLQKKAPMVERQSLQPQCEGGHAGRGERTRILTGTAGEMLLAPCAVAQTQAA